MNGSRSSCSNASSGGCGGDTSPFAYNMMFIISSIFLVLIITVSYCCLCIRANRRAIIMARFTFNGSTEVGGGIDEATLRSYPTVLFSSAKHHEKNDLADSIDVIGGGSCSICLGEYKEGEVLRLLPECEHVFHMKCVDPWLRLHATCPVCRKSPVAGAGAVAVRVDDADSPGGDR
ncbi:hypothetical protein BT93_K0042 [Corymbia citriodora subsp. variegata]|nr:hypothetical protein BT93_K0042 [Corymbia citriodora subsp. variegata]